MGSIGARVKQAREAAGYGDRRQAHAARSIGIRPPSLSQIESGTTKSPSADTLLTMARVWRVSPLWLIFGKGAMKAAYPTTDDEESLLSIFRDLSRANKAALLASARAMLDSQGRDDDADNNPRRGLHVRP